MWCVYIIRSINSPEHEYIGATADLKRRLPDHNAGKSAHTAKFKPWELVWYCAFPDKYKALEFEKYLKSHSGRAFTKKRLSLGQARPTPPPAPWASARVSANQP
jgi:putative endonuclease